MDRRHPPERKEKGDPRIDKKCWCGARRGQSCRDVHGKETMVHNTRGMPKKVVVAMARAAGLPWPK